MRFVIQRLRPDISRLAPIGDECLRKMQSWIQFERPKHEMQQIEIPVEQEFVALLEAGGEVVFEEFEPGTSPVTGAE